MVFCLQSLIGYDMDTVSIVFKYDCCWVKKVYYGKYHILRIV